MTDTATITINGVHFEVQVPSYLVKEITTNMEQGSTSTLKRKFGERVAESIRDVIPVDGLRSSERQMDYAIVIAHRLELDIPANILNREVCGEFISKHIDEFKEVDPIKRDQEKNLRSIFKLVTRAIRLRKARRLLDEGVAIEDVAEQMNVGSHTIEKYLIELLEIEAQFAKDDCTEMLENLIGQVESGIDLYEKHIPYNPASPY